MVFSPAWGIIGLSHFHVSFSNSSPFKREVRRGMGIYVAIVLISP